MRRLLTACATLLFALCAATTPAEEEKRTVLDGLHRAELVALLGEPDKAKRAGDGEVLVFKVLTVADDHVLAPDERMIDLPGLGRCVRRIPVPQEGYRRSIEFEPTQVNEEGRMEGGSMTQSESVERNVDLDEPLPKTKPDGDRRTGKAKLHVTLGRDGHVVDWKTKGGR